MTPAFGLSSLVRLVRYNLSWALDLCAVGHALTLPQNVKESIGQGVNYEKWTLVKEGSPATRPGLNRLPSPAGAPTVATVKRFLVSQTKRVSSQRGTIAGYRGRQAKRVASGWRTDRSITSHNVPLWTLVGEVYTWLSETFTLSGAGIGAGRGADCALRCFG